MTRTGRWRSLFLEHGNAWLGEEHFPQKVTAVYVMCAFFSLYMADRYIHPYFPAPVDDVVYVSFTAFILYRILRGGVRTLRAKETALRESEDRLARILETNAGGIVVFDAEGAITFANQSAEKILGVERSRLIGLRHDDPIWEMTDVDGAPIGHEELPLLKVRAARDAGVRRTVRRQASKRSVGLPVRQRRPAPRLVERNGRNRGLLHRHHGAEEGGGAEESGSSSSPSSRALPPSSSPTSRGTWSTRTTGTTRWAAAP